MNRRVGILLVAVGLLSLLTFLFLAQDLSGHGARNRDEGTSLSRRNLGHLAALELLKARGLDVRRSRHRSEHRAQACGGLLVYAEPSLTRFDPNADPGTDQLIVLPKWRLQPQVENFYEMAQEIAFFDWGASVSPTHLDAMPPLPINVIAAVPTTRTPVQALQVDPASDWDVLVGDDSAALLVQRVDNGRSIWVLSDPDILANHGIGLGQNCEFVEGLFRHIAGDRPIIFDETHHGLSLAPSLLSVITSYPTSLLSLVLVLIAGFALWMAAGRFGRPIARASSGLDPGKTPLIENVAELQAAAGAPLAAADSLWRTVRWEVATALKVRGEGAALLASLDRCSERARCRETATTLQSALDSLPKGRKTSEFDALQLAQRIHAWRQEILHGPQRT